jgi:hypothetical protein
VITLVSVFNDQVSRSFLMIPKELINRVETMLPDGRLDIRTLYYITHVNNIPFILKNGILSHDLVKKTGIQYYPIYDEAVVSRRKNKIV